jgi:hypothetical protein
VSGLEAEIFIAYYGFAHIRGTVPEHSSGSNTREADEGTFTGDGLKYDYDSVNPILRITRTWESRNGKEYFAALVGDFVYNFDVEDTGYLLGFNAGRSSIGEIWAWQIHYNWRRLETDAFLDIFPDSDFYGGATNVSGHEFILSVGLGEGFALGLDYYRTERIEGNPAPRDLLQADLVVKF